MSGTVVWGIFACLVLLLGLVFLLVHLSGKAALTSKTQEDSSAVKSESDAMVDIANKAAQRPSKADVVKSMRDATFVVALVFLSSCAHGYKYVCPPMPTYSKDFLGKAADQLTTLDDNSPVVVIIEDTWAIRKACKR